MSVFRAALPTSADQTCREPAAHRAIAIREIADLIQIQCRSSPRALLACRSVCKEWKEVADRHIFETIEVDDYGQWKDALTMDVTSWFRWQTTARCALVRQIRISNPLHGGRWAGRTKAAYERCLWLLGSCINITVADMPLYMLVEASTLPSRLATPCFPKLQHLSGGVDVQTLTNPVFGNFSSLSNLSLNIRRAKRFDDIVRNLASMASSGKDRITHLRLNWEAHRLAGQQDSLERFRGRLVEFPKLVHLEISSAADVSPVLVYLPRGMRRLTLTSDYHAVQSALLLLADDASLDWLEDAPRLLVHKAAYTRKRSPRARARGSPVTEFMVLEAARGWEARTRRPIDPAIVTEWMQATRYAPPSEPKPWLVTGGARKSNPAAGGVMMPIADLAPVSDSDESVDDFDVDDQ